jgi:hypothetical protein
MASFPLQVLKIGFFGVQRGPCYANGGNEPKRHNLIFSKLGIGNNTERDAAVPVAHGSLIVTCLRESLV